VLLALLPLLLLLLLLLLPLLLPGLLQLPTVLPAMSGSMSGSIKTCLTPPPPACDDASITPSRANKTPPHTHLSCCIVSCLACALVEQAYEDIQHGHVAQLVAHLLKHIEGVHGCGAKQATSSDRGEGLECA
jgi:hypothetical protein